METPYQNVLMSNHNQSHYSRLTGDSSLITLLFLRRIQYTASETDTAMINTCLILGVDRKLLVVVRKMFSLHKHLMNELEC